DWKESAGLGGRLLAPPALGLLKEAAAKKEPPVGGGEGFRGTAEGGNAIAGRLTEGDLAGPLRSRGDGEHKNALARCWRSQKCVFTAQPAPPADIVVIGSQKSIRP